LTGTLVTAMTERNVDPNLQAWRSATTALGNQLVDLESHHNVELARGGALVGGTAATWADAEAGLSAAWETYRVLDEVLDDAEAHPERAAALLTTASVPGAGGEATDPSSALRAASAAVDAAVAVADRLAGAWDQLAPRVGAVRAAAASAGDGATERAAAALAELVASDPFAVSEADVVALEQRADASGSRRAAEQAALARLDVDLVAAQDTLAELTADAETAAGELAHAASRVVGVDTTAPVPDLSALAGWLDRIASAASASPASPSAASTGSTTPPSSSAARAHAASELTAWREAAQARRAELDAALAPARSGMRRRAEGQGLWTALRAKAGARKLDEQPAVADALTEARDLLWTAPCDLAAAEAALARLSAVLTTNPAEAKEDR
jgi:hypothetical protein